MRTLLLATAVCGLLLAPAHAASPYPPMQTWAADINSTDASGGLDYEAIFNHAVQCSAALTIASVSKTWAHLYTAFAQETGNLWNLGAIEWGRLANHDADYVSGMMGNRNQAYWDLATDPATRPSVGRDIEHCIRVSPLNYKPREPSF